MIRDRRIGTFQIRLNMIELNPAAVRAVLRDVIVLRAETIPWHELVEYVGIHDAFAPVEVGEEPSRYMAEVQETRDPETDEIARTVTWRPAR